MTFIKWRFPSFLSPHLRKQEEITMPNPVMHWQILTRQPKELEDFYSALFGWTISGDNPLGYKQVDTNSTAGIHGGLVAHFRKGGPQHGAAFHPGGRCKSPREKSRITRRPRRDSAANAPRRR